MIECGTSAVIVRLRVVEFNGGKDRIVIGDIETSDGEGDVVRLVCLEGRGDGEFVGCIAVQNVHKLLFLDRSCDQCVSTVTIEYGLALPIIIARPLGSVAIIYEKTLVLK